ncbi:hypothetical protein U9M48_036917 [Paspalum notatum var. saurae]|uniref:Uncharacterized protein n=1 Tax=Paspalum notatum var. saurae TaxID=547442 RepID=A0AAQ3UIJ9_PASNO
MSFDKMNRRFKQVAKGFVGKMVPSKKRSQESLFQGSTLQGARREALLRCVDPNLEGVPIALQRTEDEEEEAGAGHKDEEDEAGAGHENEEAGADEDQMGGDGSEEVIRVRRTRKSHYVHPPPIPAPADRKLIRPIGDSQWKDVTWDGTGHRRTPNGLLGNIIRVNNPGVVEMNGETIPVTTWKHFALAPPTYGSAQGLVRHKFWVTNAWLKAQGQQLGAFRDSSEIYLTAEQYGQVTHPLFEDQPGPYKALCDLWASKRFQEQSRKHRHPGTKKATHKLGGDGYRRKVQRMVARTGEEPSAVDLYIMAHKGPDPSQPEVLSAPLATERLKDYGQEMVRLHGEEYDWRSAPVDPQAVYDSGSGKSHGRFAMFNGLIDSRGVQRGSSSHSAGGSSSRQRRTTSDMEIESLKQEIERRDAFLKAQAEYQRQRDAHHEYSMFQQQGMTFVMPEVRPPPVPPQWGQFAQMPFSSAAPAKHSGQNIDPALGDFVNNLFAFGGSGHNSNDPGAMMKESGAEYRSQEWLIFGGWAPGRQK